jgi:hypothetical protein
MHVCIRVFEVFRSGNCKTISVDLVHVLTCDIYWYLCCYACYIDFEFIV